MQDKFYCFGIFFCWKVRISWKKDHPNYLTYLPRPKEPISPKTVQLQGQAVANRKGSCNRLANITKPTLVIVHLLLIGQDEVIYGSIDTTLDRARRLIPHIQTEIIPNAAHLPNVDQPELVNARILKFLAE